MNGTKTKKRTIWLWGFAGWVLVLGAIGLWRGAVLWQERTLLSELESRLSPGEMVALIGAFALCGAGLVVSAIGLVFRQDWARISTRIAIPLHVGVFQIYSWGFVHSGLMFERRWVALLSSAAAVLIGITALTWERTRTWMGLVERVVDPVIPSGGAALGPGIDTCTASAARCKWESLTHKERSLERPPRDDT